MRNLFVCVGVMMLAVGCDGSKLSSREAEQVFQSQTQMIGSVYRSVYDAVEGVNVPEGITVEADATGGSISGTLSGDDAWSGEATIDGSAEIDSENYDYVFDLALGYVGVSVEELGVMMDGDVSVFTEAHLDLDGGTLSYAFDTSGDLAVSGEVSGQTAFAFALAVGVDVNAGSFTLDVGGDVDGFDASEFDLPSAASWVDALYN